jgi:hypothetical protein
MIYHKLYILNDKLNEIPNDVLNYAEWLSREKIH